MSMEKAMAPHSSTLDWKIPWTEEPGRLQSMGPLRVRHDWATSPSLFTFMHWRRKWQPTPLFLPGESQGRGSLVGCCLWSHTVRHDWSDLAAAAAAARHAVNRARAIMPHGKQPLGLMCTWEKRAEYQIGSLEPPQLAAMAQDALSPMQEQKST